MEISRFDVWCAVDDLRERVDAAANAVQAQGIAVYGLAVLEVLLRPAVTPVAAALPVETSPIAAALERAEALSRQVAETPPGTPPPPPANPAVAAAVRVADALSREVAETPAAAATMDTAPGLDYVLIDGKQRGLTGIWTAERVALLRALWHQVAEVSGPRILEQLRALPGPRIPDKYNLNNDAAKWGLHSSRFTWAEMMKKGVAPVPAPAALPPGVSAEDAAEAQSMRAQGKDAREIGEYFGWTGEVTQRVLAFTLPKPEGAA